MEIKRAAMVSIRFATLPPLFANQRELLPRLMAPRVSIPPLRESYSASCLTLYFSTGNFWLVSHFYFDYAQHKPERVFEPNRLEGKTITDQTACSVDEIPAKNPYIVDERGKVSGKEILYMMFYCAVYLWRFRDEDLGNRSPNRYRVPVE